MEASKRAGVVARLFKKYGSVCFYCEIPLTVADATIDHYIPRSAGGPNHITNLRPSCFPCNNDKADRVPNEDGSLPPRSARSRVRKSQRPAVCGNCQNGRLLRAGEWCPLCQTGPQPIVRPHYLKRRTWQCDHDAHWCIACCLATDEERLELALASLAKAASDATLEEKTA
jgi:hypothetical protein